MAPLQQRALYVAGGSGNEFKKVYDHYNDVLLGVPWSSLTSQSPERSSARR